MQLFKKGITPSDVCQGKLADCYFLSCLATLAETPGCIEGMFNTKTVNAAGIYSVNFYVNGKRQEVVVDDYVPCDPKNNHLPCFAYSSQMGEIWAMIIEKAWAKLHGTYCMIRKGSTLSALPHMTGAASQRFDHNYISDLDDFWSTVSEAHGKKYVITGSTNETDMPTASSGSRRSCIVSGHSYSILSTHAFKQSGQKVKLLRLRNPQGSMEWQGDWSDKSDKWTAKLRKECGAT